MHSLSSYNTGIIVVCELLHCTCVIVTHVVGSMCSIVTFFVVYLAVDCVYNVSNKSATAQNMNII
jgi:hypothetical protein